MGKGRGLTERQRVFVREYLLDLNATRAAIRAGYSIQNANSIGPRLVGKR
jgi:phage terminase small subunit